MTDTHNGLTDLLKAYVSAEPARARGGIVALSGYDYQIWSYLADFATALSSNELLSGGAEFAHAFEALSDYTRRAENGTICVQVKSHLDRPSMASAAAEFAAIARFIECRAPTELFSLLKYEVVARTGSADLDWTTIQLPQDIKKREPDLIHYFEKIRDEGRLLTPRFEPDPHWKLIAAVYKDLVDPFGFARKAFELCMRRTRDPSSGAFVRSAIAEEYAANLRKRNRASRSLSASDFSRDPEGRGISLARTPTLGDLRCGCFMERPSRVADVLPVLDDHRSKGGVIDAAIQVLWIDGRSGCGKSVLLLQIMERLVVEDQASVIWFANLTEELGTIIEQIADSEPQLRPDFLVVDDIYDPQSRDDLDLSRLTRLIVHSGVTEWPILITCGPTEFRQDFERDCRAEGFHVIPWHLSTLEPAETTLLRNWFQSRTGRLPERGSALMEKRALMISVMFELEHGDLRPFASRFRNRLVEDRLDSVLSIPLALNRLYIWTPRGWLSNDEQARLERLNQDGDFSVLSVEGRGHDLFKLTHPHLSDAIYRALHPGAVPTTFARHLVAAFSRALTSHLPTAVRLLRAVVAQQSRLDIVDEDELAVGMTAAWNTWDKVGMDQAAAVEMWVDWARWAARHSVIATLLLESPFEKAISMLGRDLPRSLSLWIRLWTCLPGEPKLVRHAKEWLSSHAAVDGWSSVWRRVMEYSVQCSRELNMATETTTMLCQLGIERLNVESDLFAWSRIWVQLVDARQYLPVTSHDELIRRGVAWVFKFGHAPGWNLVWEKLATLSEAEGFARKDIDELGLTWLNEHKYHPGWPFVWQHFMNGPSLPESVTREQIIQVGVTWSSANENDPSWVFIVKALAAEADDEGRARAFERLVVWIETHAGSPHWPVVWYVIFARSKNMLTHQQRRRLFVAGREWVAADDEDYYAPLVLTNIVVSLSEFLEFADETALVKRACAVLSRTVNADSGEWPRLWFAVTKHVRTWSSDKSTLWVDALRILGRRWIGNPAHLRDGAWSQVYRRVYRDESAHEAPHRDLAIRGTIQGLIPDGAGLTAWLYTVPTSAPPPDDLIQWFDQWFANSVPDSGGFSVWLRLDHAARDALTRGQDAQWMKLRSILDSHRPVQATRWQTVIDHYRRQQPLVGRVVKTVLQKKWGNRPKRLGYVVDIGTNAFLPLEEAGIELGSETARLALVGQVYEFDITRLDEIKLQVDVSCRTLVHRQREQLAALVTGALVKGRVKKIYPYGVIVNLGFTDAFLHISEMGEDPPKHPSDLLKIGQHIETRVLSLNISQRRVKLTMKASTT